MATEKVLESGLKFPAVTSLSREETEARATNETTSQRAARPIDEIARACGASNDHSSRGRSQNRAASADHCKAVGN